MARAMVTGPRNPTTTNQFGTLGRSMSHRISDHDRDEQDDRDEHHEELLGDRLGSQQPVHDNSFRTSQTTAEPDGPPGRECSLPASRRFSVPMIMTSACGPGGVDVGQGCCIVLTGDPCGELLPLGIRTDRCRHQVGGIEAERRFRILETPIAVCCTALGTLSPAGRGSPRSRSPAWPERSRIPGWPGSTGTPAPRDGRRRPRRWCHRPARLYRTVSLTAGK